MVRRRTRAQDGRMGSHARPPTACPNVLDVGTGNGHLLFDMVDAGYDASRLTGIDYSRGSVDLSIAIAKQRDVEDEGKYTYANVTFAVCGFLDPASSIRRPSADVNEVRTETTNDGIWDLVLDKGTFDAMSLMDEDERGTVSLERYVPRVDELIQRIAIRGSGLEYKGSIPYKHVTFGGKSGSSYATVAFQKHVSFASALAHPTNPSSPLNAFERKNISPRPKFSVLVALIKTSSTAAS
ncbi:hypothetical protein EV363DRAFT_1346661, partial [Boletus edulis]